MRIKKPEHLLLFVLALSLFSCKKDTGPKPATNQSTTSTSSTLCNGFFLTTRTTSMYLPPIANTHTKGHSASFTTSPSPKANNNIYALVDSVFLNNSKLSLDNNNANLSYSAGFNDTCTCFPTKWQVYGNSTIPGLTYVDSLPFPDYAGYNVIGDTIDRSQNFTLPLTGLSNFDLLSVSFCGNVTFSKSFSSSVPTSITFLHDSLALLTPGTGSFIKVWLTRNNYQTFAGKNFNFIKQYVFYRCVYLK